MTVGTDQSPSAGIPRPGERAAGLAEPPAEAKPPRNRYIDTLRAAALLRVLVFHLFAWAWLPLVFPSMGLMFAFAGSLMAASLDRSSVTTVQVLRKRLRRLLPPLWAFGLVIVPIMVLAGWTSVLEDEGARPLGPWMVSWIIPITEPPGSDLGLDWTFPLWYLRTYLWLVLLSPALLWLWRHWPRTMYTLPFLAILLIAGGLLPAEGPLGDGVISVLTFATCWMLGFAHHDGRLQKVRLQRIMILGAVLCAAGVAWAIRYPLPADTLPNVSDIPLAQALFSLGFSMVLLRLPLTLSFVDRVPVLRGIIDVINRRAMTIYLWGSVAIFLALEILDRAGRPDADVNAPWTAAGTTLLILFVILLAVGWVEDLAVRQRPRLLPLGARAPLAPRARRRRRRRPISEEIPTA